MWFIVQYDHGRDDFTAEYTVTEVKNFVQFNKLHVVVDFDTTVCIVSDV